MISVKRVQLRNQSIRTSKKLSSTENVVPAA